MSAVPKLIRARAITYAPEPHHVPAIAHLLERPLSGLLMDPGTGKTGCVLAAYHVLRQKKLVDRLLVVAPLRPCYSTWPAEVEKWGFPYTVTVLHGSKKDEALNYDADIFVINYDGLGWLARTENLKRLLRHGKRWWLVPDESTKVKHTNTQRFKTLRALLPKFDRRTILTGTPSPNGLGDLFGQVYVIDLGARLGRFITHYRREFFYPTGYGGYTWVLQQNAEKKIYARLDGLFYRVDESVLKLKPLRHITIPIDLPTTARATYKELEEEFVAELASGVITAVNAGVLSSKLRQATNGFLYDEDRKVIPVHDEKIDALVDLVEELQGNPLLVGYEFTADAERITAALKKLRIAAPIVGGGLSAKAADEYFRDFNAGKIPVLVCQMGATAHGLNLQQACHHIALFGLTWNLETYLQFIKRVHRAGQKKAVFVHRIIARNTIDARLAQALERKDRSQSSLLKYIQESYVK